MQDQGLWFVCWSIPEYSGLIGSQRRSACQQIHACCPYTHSAPYTYKYIYTHILIVHSIQILIYTLSAPYIPYILSYTPVVSPHTPYILIVHQRHLVISPILDSTIAIVHHFPPVLVLIKLFSNSDQAREQPHSSLEKINLTFCFFCHFFSIFLHQSHSSSIKR